MSFPPLPIMVICYNDPNLDTWVPEETVLFINFNVITSQVVSLCV